MKKIIALALALVMVLGLAACSVEKTEAPAPTAAPAATEAPKAEAPAATEAAAYGQRMLEQQSAQRLYQALGRHLKYADGWKKYIITSEPEFEHYFGRRADKKRKLYNGMIKCDYYMYTDNQRKKSR